MKKIDVSTKKFPNTFALVDDCDFERLNKFKWSVAEKNKGKFYIMRKILVSGKRSTLWMHTEIMGKVEGKEIDHRTGNRLNNQRHNLRHCTHAENMRNKDISSNNTSGYKGVTWNKGHNKWRAGLVHAGRPFFLGYHFCLIKAARAYDQKAIELHKEFASLNFKGDKNNE